VLLQSGFFVWLLDREINNLTEQDCKHFQRSFACWPTFHGLVIRIYTSLANAPGSIHVEYVTRLIYEYVVGFLIHGLVVQHLF